MLTYQGVDNGTFRYLQVLGEREPHLNENAPPITRYQLYDWELLELDEGSVAKSSNYFWIFHHVFTMFLPCFSYVLTMCLPCFHTFSPCVCHVFTKCSSCVHQVFVRFPPCFCRVSTMFSPSVHHVSTMFLPCVYHVFTMCLPCVTSEQYFLDFSKGCSLRVPG